MYRRENFIFHDYNPGENLDKSLRRRGAIRKYIANLATETFREKRGRVETQGEGRKKEKEERT